MTQLAVADFTIRANSGDLGTDFDPNTHDTSASGLTIVSGATAPSSAGSDSSEVSNAATYPADQYAEVTYKATAANGAGSGTGPTCRATLAAATYYRAIGNASGYQCSRANANVFTSLMSGSGTTFAANDRFSLRVRTVGANALLELLKNGAVFDSVMDTTPLAAGSAGIGYSSTDTGTTVKLWAAGDLVSSSAGPNAAPRSLRPGPFRGMLPNLVPATGTGVSPDVTVALTGQSATFSAGTLTPSTNVPVLGKSATFTAGTLTPNTAVPLTGQAATFTAGTLTPSAAVPLAGQSATFTAGTLAPSNDSTVALTGQAATFTAGTLAPATAVPLAGQGGTFTAGTVTPATNAPLTGQSGAFSAGSLSPATDVPLAGQSATFTVGTLTVLAAGDVTVALTGASATFTAGQIIATAASTGEVFFGGFLFAYEHERTQRRHKQREQEDLEAEAHALQDKVDREIAELLRRQEAEDARRAELARLQQLVHKFSHNDLELSDRAKIAYVRALAQANFSALEALDRELQRMLEEEEITALMLILNED